MASPNSTFTELVTTTLRSHPSEISDAVSGHNALYNRIQKRGNIKKTTSGGYEIVRPLDIVENSNFQRYSGFDTLSIQAGDVLSAAKYDWVQSAVSIVASGRDLRMNSGKEKIIDLMKARTKNAIRTASNNMSVDLYSSGSLTNQMGGLGLLIQTNGQGTVGGIDSGTYTAWRNQFTEMTGTNTYADIRNDMLALYLLCVRGTDKPDLIVSTYDLYKAYWDALSDNQRYRNVSNNDGPPDTFQSILFQGSDVVFDNNTNFTTTGEKMYFLNTDYIELVVHSDADWTPLEEKTSNNQDAAVVTMIWMGQLVTSNRARQGVLIDAS